MDSYDKTAWVSPKLINLSIENTLAGNSPSECEGVNFVGTTGPDVGNNTTAPVCLSGS